MGKPRIGRDLEPSDNDRVERRALKKAATRCLSKTLAELREGNIALEIPLDERQNQSSSAELSLAMGEPPR